MNVDSQSVYLSFQLPERELDWLLGALLPQLNPQEHVWVLHEQEYGDNAQLASTLEKVTGRAKTSAVRLLCTAERADQLLKSMAAQRRPEGIRWQIQPLLASGHL
ncbi:MAG: DUF3240 family protein [Limnobacter sp.]|nr:DUF3240 family protein [Limnobacter sp.]